MEESTFVAVTAALSGRDGRPSFEWMPELCSTRFDGGDLLRGPEPVWPTSTRPASGTRLAELDQTGSGPLNQLSRQIDRKAPILIKPEPSPADSGKRDQSTCLPTVQHLSMAPCIADPPDPQRQG